MKDIKTLPYAGWLEGAIRALMDKDVDCIAIAARTKNEEVLTAYYEASLSDKAVIAAFIQGDAMLDMAVNNAKLIVEAAEEEDDDGGI